MDPRVGELWSRRNCTGGRDCLGGDVLGVSIASPCMPDGLGLCCSNLRGNDGDVVGLRGLSNRECVVDR